MNNGFIDEKWYYQMEGRGSPFIFLHGLLGFGRNLRNLSKNFQNHYTCFFYDQRGHGKSFHKGPYNLNQLCEDLYFISQFQEWNRFYLLGHSLGGYVALHFANIYPEKIKKMIILDSSPNPISKAIEENKRYIHFLPHSFSTRNEARSFFNKSIEKNDVDPVVGEFLFSNIVEKRKGEWDFGFDKEGLMNLSYDIRSHDYWSIIKNLKVETLFLRGENSKYFSKNDFDQLSLYSNYIKGMEIKNSSHWIHHEQRDLCFEIIKEFLNNE